MVKRFLPVLMALALLAGVVVSAWPRAVVSAAAGCALVLRFPVAKDFGGVSGKVLYVRRDLPEWMPLRCAADRVEAPSGFFPAGRTVTVLYVGSRIGSAVAGTGPLSVPVSSPPGGSTVAVVESDQELPAARWVNRGVPKWSGSKDAAMSTAAGVIGGKIAVLVKHPDPYTNLRALAVFDGLGWQRGVATFLADPYFGMTWADNGQEFWFGWSPRSGGTPVVSTCDLGATWVDRSPRNDGKYLLAAGGDVYFNDVGGIWWCTGRLYRWDRVQGRWVDVGPAAGLPYAVQGGQIYCASGPAVKKFASGAWVDVSPLPPGPTSWQSLAVAADGTLWLMDGSGVTWRKGPGDGSWRDCGKVLGQSKGQIVAMPDGSVWAAVGSLYGIARWEGVWADQGFPVRTDGLGIGAALLPGPAGSLYVVTTPNYYNMSTQGLWELPCALEP